MLRSGSSGRFSTPGCRSGYVMLVCGCGRWMHTEGIEERQVRMQEKCGSCVSNVVDVGCASG